MMGAVGFGDDGWAVDAVGWGEEVAVVKGGGVPPLFSAFIPAKAGIHFPAALVDEMDSAFAE